MRYFVTMNPLKTYVPGGKMRIFERALNLLAGGGK